MKKIVMFFVMIMVVLNVYASIRGVTVEGFVFARTKDQMNKVIKYLDDKKAFNTYVNQLEATGQGGILAGGIEVYIEDSSWGLVEIRPAGSTQTVWTVTEAVKRR